MTRRSWRYLQIYVTDSFVVGRYITIFTTSMKYTSGLYTSKHVTVVRCSMFNAARSSKTCRSVGLYYYRLVLKRALLSVYLFALVLNVMRLVLNMEIDFE